MRDMLPTATVIN